jgi:hypothetical protein
MKRMMSETNGGENIELGNWSSGRWGTRRRGRATAQLHAMLSFATRVNKWDMGQQMGDMGQNMANGPASPCNKWPWTQSRPTPRPLLVGRKVACTQGLPVRRTVLAPGPRRTVPASPNLVLPTHPGWRGRGPGWHAGALGRTRPFWQRSRIAAAGWPARRSRRWSAECRADPSRRPSSAGCGCAPHTWAGAGGADRVLGCTHAAWGATCCKARGGCQRCHTNAHQGPSTWLAVHNW